MVNSLPLSDSLSAPLSGPSVPAARAWPHLAFLALVPAATSSKQAAAAARHADASEDAISGTEGWLECCYRLTAQVQRLDARHAVLDLGSCAPDEARAVAETLLRRLSRHGVTARIGLGPSLTLAQLALCRRPGAPADQRCSVRLLTPEEAPALLRTAPVRWLPAFYPRGEVTPAVVARLERYGLRTLAPLARLDLQALQRQFGRTVGVALAAFARGTDPLPLVPTRPPHTLAVRLRFAEPIAPEHLAAAMPRLARRAVSHLAGGQVTRSVTLSLRWERRGWASASSLLRGPVSTEREVARECTRLLTILLADEDSTHGTDLAERAHCRLTGLTARPPLQTSFTPSFTRTHTQQRTAAEQVAQVLSRRYGPGIITALRPTAPDAIFPEERYALRPLVPTDAVARAAPLPSPDGRLRTAAAAWADVPQRLHWW